MNQVYTLPVNSAELQTPEALESAFLSGQTGQIGSFSQSYTIDLWCAADLWGRAAAQSADDGY